MSCLLTPFTVSDIFGEGWFKSFNILNLYAITSIIMVIEIVVFNSIKRPFVSVCRYNALHNLLANSA